MGGWIGRFFREDRVIHVVPQPREELSSEYPELMRCISANPTFPTYGTISLEYYSYVLIVLRFDCNEYRIVRTMTSEGSLVKVFFKNSREARGSNKVPIIEIEGTTSKRVAKVIIERYFGIPVKTDNLYIPYGCPTGLIKGNIRPITVGTLFIKNRNTTRLSVRWLDSIRSVKIAEIVLPEDLQVLFHPVIETARELHVGGEASLYKIFVMPHKNVLFVNYIKTKSVFKKLCVFMQSKMYSMCLGFRATEKMKECYLKCVKEMEGAVEAATDYCLHYYFPMVTMYKEFSVCFKGEYIYMIVWDHRKLKSTRNHCVHPGILDGIFEASMKTVERVGLDKCNHCGV